MRENGSGLSLFAAELAAARSAAGLTQDQLAARINYSASLIAMIESMRRAPQPDVAQRLDEALKMPGTFVRLQQHARTTPLPTWFRPYAEIEATATQLRSWQPAFVDGLLQTEAYAESVLSRRPNTKAEDVEALVAARMERQAILDRDEPPLLWVVLDEAVLHRRVASEKVMREQLDHLLDVSARPNVVVEVVPYSAGGHYALLGAFALVEQEGLRLGYLETISDGFIVESAATVARLALTFDHVRAETLSRTASRELIEKRANASWT
jgi:transcriptional regulator with XRE-family HTH domain